MAVAKKIKFNESENKKSLTKALAKAEAEIKDLQERLHALELVNLDLEKKNARLEMEKGRLSRELHSSNNIIANFMLREIKKISNSMSKKSFGTAYTVRKEETYKTILNSLRDPE
jgi:hypothetical protein